MFDGLTAWFSKSVLQKRVTSWTDHGGTEQNTFHKAIFVFSEHANSEDTGCIYQSEAYLCEHLSVIHASYIDACLADDISSVVVGDYILPPADVQIEIGELTKFAWQTDESQIPHATQPEEKTSYEPLGSAGIGPVVNETVPESSSHGSRVSACFSEYITVDDLPRMDGDLNDFIVGQDGCLVFRTTSAN